MEPVDLLLVEDNDRDATYVERLLVEGVGDHLVEPGDVRRAVTLSEAIDKLDETPDAILLDLNLPDSDGLETVEAVVDHAPHVPVVVITGSRGTDLGPTAIKHGAQDYLRKGHITAEVLHRTIRYAIDRQETQQEIVELNRRLALLNRLVRQDIRDDLQMVVGRGDELRGHVTGQAESTLDALLAAADHALEHTERAGEVMQTLSSEHELTTERFDVTEIVRAQVEWARERFSGEFTVEDPAEDAIVETSPAIGSAVAQLLANAARHTNRDWPRVQVGIETGPETVTVSIADDGVGMSEHQRALLNDPETRFHEGSGIGTGLYLALTVIEQVSGHVEFSQNQPRGTVVTVTLERASNGP